MSNTVSTVRGSQNTKNGGGDWRLRGACVSLPVDDSMRIYYPQGPTAKYRKDIRSSREICRGCPVQMDCLIYAVIQRDDYGTWGGLTEWERFRLIGNIRRLDLWSEWVELFQDHDPRLWYNICSLGHKERSCGTCYQYRLAMGLPNEMSICANCDEEFESTKKGQTYCNPDCYAESLKKKVKRPVVMI